MIEKITQAIKAVFAPEKKPKSSIEYRDQPPWTVRHSSLDSQQPQADDGWLSANGRYDLKNWVNRR